MGEKWSAQGERGKESSGGEFYEQEQESHQGEFLNAAGMLGQTDTSAALVQAHARQSLTTRSQYHTVSMILVLQFVKKYVLFQVLMWTCFTLASLETSVWTFLLIPTLGTVKVGKTGQTKLCRLKCILNMGYFLGNLSSSLWHLGRNAVPLSRKWEQ
jgi:hypothetical protein